MSACKHVGKQACQRVWLEEQDQPGNENVAAYRTPARDPHATQPGSSNSRAASASNDANAWNNRIPIDSDLFASAHRRVEGGGVLPAKHVRIPRLSPESFYRSYGSEHSRLPKALGFRLDQCRLEACVCVRSGMIFWSGYLSRNASSSPQRLVPEPLATLAEEGGGSGGNRRQEWMALGDRSLHTRTNHDGEVSGTHCRASSGEGALHE